MSIRDFSPILLLGGRRNKDQKAEYDQVQQQLEEAGFAVINPWQGMGDYWRCYSYNVSEYGDEERIKLENFWQQKLAKIKQAKSVVLFLTMLVAPGQIIECWEAKKLGKEIFAIYLDKEYPNCTHLIKCFSKIYQTVEEFVKDQKE